MTRYETNLLFYNKNIYLSETIQNEKPVECKFFRQRVISKKETDTAQTMIRMFLPGFVYYEAAH
jgi:hypothetical protein